MTTAPSPFARISPEAAEQKAQADARAETKRSKQRNDLIAVAETDNGIGFLARLFAWGAHPFPTGLRVAGDAEETAVRCDRHEFVGKLAHELNSERPDLYQRVLREVANG